MFQYEYEGDKWVGPDQYRTQRSSRRVYKTIGQSRNTEEANESTLELRRGDDTAWAVGGMQRSQKKYHGKTSETGRGAKEFEGGDCRHVYREGLRFP